MDIQVSDVYLSTGDTVVNRKAYLWEFEYLVCIYLREQQWATECVFYLSLFFEKLVLCVVCSIVLLCVFCWVV